MGVPIEPKPVKLFSGLIFQSNDVLPQVREKLIELFGKIDFESDTTSFDITDYYENEMGRNLKRKFLSFSILIPADSLPEVKLKTNEIEAEFSSSKTGNRSINIDPGYLSMEKLVLASAKNYSHRPYLSSGIFAELTYIYKRGSYTTLDWTYPDYRTPDKIEMFNQLRKEYVDQLGA